MHRSNYRCYPITSSSRAGSDGGIGRAPSAQIAFQTRTFSLGGSNGELWGERDPSVNGICDEAVGFDAFHGFAGGLEFGVALESDAGVGR